MPTILACPECGKKLKLQNAPKSGQRIRCPQCEHIFTPDAEEEEREAIAERSAPKRRPARPSDEDEDRPVRKRSRADDEEEDERPRSRRRRDEDDDDEEERPRSRRRDDDDEDEDERPRKKKKKRRGGGFPWLWVSIGAGSFVVVLVLLFVIFPSLNPFESDYSKNARAAKELFAIGNDLVSIMESVKSPEAARSAAAKIERLAERMESLSKRVADLPKLSAADNERLKKEFEPKIREMETRSRNVGIQVLEMAGKDPAFAAAMQKFGRASVGLNKSALGSIR